MSNRPRPSILEMFDPLARPSTPPRDGSSSDSDKENSQPPNADLGMTAIFGRTYKLPHCSPTQPRQLKTRLVDVGDVTLDLSQVNVQDYDSDEEDQHLLTMTMPEDDEESAESETEHEQPPVEPRLRSGPSTPRTPLGELQLEQETPIFRSKMFKREVLDFSPRTPQAFAKSPLSSVIDRVNASGRTFASQEPASPALGSPMPSPKLGPEIKVSAVDSESDNGDEADVEENENDVPEPKPASPQPALRPSPNLRPNPRDSFASNTSNRMSLDLQSSFQLHFESSEASFDLMNDKISFLHNTSKGESFLADLDESLEDDENEAVDEVPATPTSPSPPTAPTTHPDPAPPVLLNDVPASASELPAVEAPSPAVSRAPSPDPVSTVTVRAPVFTAPSTASRPVAKPAVATPQIPGGRRTSMAPPALVPALRIVKRTRKEPRSSTVSSLSSTKEEAPVMVKDASAAATTSRPPRRSSVSTAQASGPRRLLTSDAPAPPVPTLRLGGSGPKRIKVPAASTPAEAPMRPTSRTESAPLRPVARTETSAHARPVPRVSSAPAPVPAKDPVTRPGVPRAVSSKLPAPSSRIPAVGRSSGLPMPASKRAVPTIRRT
ncbi:hypothetical protein K525DRAFT_253606 [Schizophyllum commune Loenen D]|nr:hypothetical protein K525DRAFT_253606 [Schizophyllum commune Loenen D]